MSEGPFFAQFLDDYFSESEEQLTMLRRALLKIEETPAGGGGEGALRDLSRALHTLKGLAGMVGFGEAERVAHVLEDWLRAHGAPALWPRGEVLEGLFEGSRLLEECIAARRAGKVRPDVDAALAPLLGGAQRADAAPHPAEPPSGEAEVPEAENARLWVFEFQPAPHLAQRGVGVATVRTRLEAFGEVVNATPRVLPSGAVAFLFRVAAQPEAEPPEEWRADGVSWSETTPEPRRVPASGNGEPATPTRPGVGRLTSANVVRVDLNRLDELMRLVGELVVSRGRLETGLRDGAFSRPGALAALQDVNTAMERQLRDLRGALLRVRLVEVGEVFERLRYAVREVARENGREVEVALRGEETEVDKLVVERMLEPLLHLVRNAVSHGIEPPAERLARGKPAAGRLTLSASTAGERIVIEVADDGAGIDIDRVQARARERGLIQVSETLDSGALLDVLCAPGLSTRDEVDLASGRGVGMEVVRSTIASLGGELLLETERGKGTRFTIELPLTLMIIDAVLIALDDQVMAVPQPTLLEVLPLETSQIVGFENNEAVSYRGGVLPLVRLRQTFGMRPDAGRTSLTVLVVGTRAQPLGLVVDRVLGLREIVVRSLADPFVTVPGIAGATELGDGRVVLILDAASLARTRRSRGPTAESTRLSGGATGNA